MDCKRVLHMEAKEAHAPLSYEEYAKRYLSLIQTNRESSIVLRWLFVRICMSDDPAASSFGLSTRCSYSLSCVRISSPCCRIVDIGEATVASNTK